jgi:putative ABC transport system substrate-binding protein
LKRRSLLQLLGATATIGALPAIVSRAHGQARPVGERPLVVFLDDTEGLQGERLELLRKAMANVGLGPDRIAFERAEVAGSDEDGVRRAVVALLKRHPAAFMTASIDFARNCVPFIAEVPLVIASPVDPAKLGFEGANGSRPFNVSGFTYDLPIEAKAFELLADAFPAARRIAVMADRNWVDFRQRQIDLPALRKRFGMEIEIIVPASPFDVRPQLHLVHPGRMDACYLPIGDVPYYSSPVLIEHFQRHRLPHLFAHDSIVTAGALMSYGVRRGSHWEPMARMLRLVIDGVPAREIPFERPKDFVLAVNVTQAKKMRITIPKSILRRANIIV